MTGSGASFNQKKRRGLICSKPLGLPKSRLGPETGIGHRGLTELKKPECKESLELRSGPGRSINRHRQEAIYVKRLTITT